MIYVDILGNIIKDADSIDLSDIDTINFELNKKYKNTNPALIINFSNNIKENIKYIKKLAYFQKSHIEFMSEYNDLKIKYIISDYNDDIITAIKAIFIDNTKEQYLFLYDNVFNSLNDLWNKNNPCKFCNNICLASKNHKSAHEKNGCCYSFDYSKNFFKFIENEKICKYLGKDKRCTTENISCKFFVCNYLKKNNLFNINMKDYLLIQAFFNKKQRLILQYNYFRSKEEILEKLTEKDNSLYLNYYFFGYYRISDNHK